MRKPPDNDRLRAGLKGLLLGSWSGFALALVIALEQRHGAEQLMLNAALAGLPLGLLGGAMAWAISYQPPPGERLQHLLRRLGTALTDDDVTQLLIDPSASTYVRLVDPNATD